MKYPIFEKLRQLDKERIVSVSYAWAQKEETGHYERGSLCLRLTLQRSAAMTTCIIRKDD